MKISRVIQVYYSPTHTTEKIVSCIAAGMGVDPRSLIENNLTYPEYADTSVDIKSDDLVIIGAPVYAGRIALTASERMQKMKFAANPAVLVAVYGNRHYDDALIDLREMALGLGLRPFAAAAFIGEHSYSTTRYPIAKDRPDAQDKTIAEEFGTRIAGKLKKIKSSGTLPELKLPGSFPLPDRRVIPPSHVETDGKRCVKCGACRIACPTAAIYYRGGYKTTPELCTVCCACIKVCPKGARIMVSEHVKGFTEMLAKKCAERRQPEIFI